MSTINEPQNSTGARGKLQKVSAVAGVGMVGLDTYMRVKDGESLPVAAGKALVTNALWSLAPGGIIGAGAAMLGYAAVTAGPMVVNALEQKNAAFNAKRNRFGSNWQSSEAQQMMQVQGINQIQNARSHMSSKMANHARNAQRVY